MGLVSGRDLLLKIETEGAFETVAGLRIKALQLNARTVDVTDAGSQGWRELLPSAGLRSAEITGRGLFRNKAADTRIRSAFFSQDMLSCRFLMPGFGTISGGFIVGRMKYAGEHDGVAGFEMNFVSAGALSFEVLP